MRKGETKSQWIARSHEIPPRHAKTVRTAIPDCAKAAQSGSPGVGGRGDRRHRRHRKDETRGREGERIRTGKPAKKGLRPSGDQAVDWGYPLCLQQKWLTPRWGGE